MPANKSRMEYGRERGYGEAGGLEASNAVCGKVLLRRGIIRARLIGFGRSGAGFPCERVGKQLRASRR